MDEKLNNDGWSVIVVVLFVVISSLLMLFRTEYIPQKNGVIIRKPFWGFLEYKSYSKKKMPNENWRYLLRYTYLESKEDCAIVVIDRYFQEAHLLRMNACLLENKKLSVAKWKVVDKDPLNLGIDKKQEKPKRVY